jgi:hypothetical protein
MINDKPLIETEKTKVIFRKWNKDIDKNQGIIAIFPEELGTMSPYTCSSWEWVGEHGACDPVMVIKSSKLATENEYLESKNYLENHYGYNLKVLKRIPRTAKKVTRKA